jgi:hypothetical protein
MKKHGRDAISARTHDPRVDRQIPKPLGQRSPCAKAAKNEEIWKFYSWIECKMRIKYMYSLIVHAYETDLLVNSGKYHICVSHVAINSYGIYQ